MIGKGSTEIHTLRTRWLDQIKATYSGHAGNLTRKQKRISGRAGKVAWKIMQIELAGIFKAIRSGRLTLQGSN